MCFKFIDGKPCGCTKQGCPCAHANKPPAVGEAPSVVPVLADVEPVTSAVGTITEPGLYPLLDEAAYHADAAPAELGGSLSQSAAKLLVPPSTPAHFRYAMDHKRVEKKSFKVGHAVHAKVLGVGADVAVIDGNRNANAVKEEIAAAEAKGLIVLKTPEFDEVNAMAEAVLAHPVAGVLFEKGRGTPEVSAFFRDDVTNVMRRARFDWLPDEQNGRVILPDLKTSESVEAAAFGKYAARYQYPMQGDWYLEALAAHDIGTKDNVFVLVAVEKDPPHFVTVSELSAEDRAIGRRLNRNAIDLFARCMETGEWPGYTTEITELQLPDWYHRTYAGA